MMKAHTHSVVIFLSFIVAFNSTFFAQVKSPAPWLPSNFDTTVGGNFRGAKITSKNQLDSMRRIYGTRTILNLAKDALPKEGESEIQWCEEFNVRYVPVYLGTSPPTAKQWELITSLLDSGNVYVHCAYGADRTGAIIARYKIEHGLLSPAKAYREARKYGFKPWLQEFRKWIGYP